jgi:hypothetical protein
LVADAVDVAWRSKAADLTDVVVILADPTPGSTLLSLTRGARTGTAPAAVVTSLTETVPLWVSAPSFPCKGERDKLGEAALTLPMYGKLNPRPR